MGNAHWGLCMNCGWNSFYANGPACAKSVLESCHLLDTELLLQNRRIKWQLAWLGSIFHLPNQTGKRGRRNQKLNIMILSHFYQYHHPLSDTCTVSVLMAVFKGTLLQKMYFCISDLCNLQYMTKNFLLACLQRELEYKCKAAIVVQWWWSIMEMLYNNRIILNK